MNYMINNEASKQVAIEFAKWTIINGMWQSDLTFEEQYECWMEEMDDQAREDDDEQFHQGELNDELAYDRWVVEQAIQDSRS